MLLLSSSDRFMLAADAVRHTCSGDVARIAAELSPGYASSLAKKNPGSADESVCAALLLLDMLAVRGFSPSQVLRGKNGKPRFASGGPEFSLSHDGGAVICAISDSPVGVDVMALSGRPGRDRQAAVAARFFTPEESGRVSGAASREEQDAVFAGIWTSREAAAKRAGGVLGDYLVRPLPVDAEFFRFEFRLAGKRYAAAVCL